MSGGRAEKLGIAESEVGSRLRVSSTESDMGSNSGAVRSGPELKSDA